MANTPMIGVRVSEPLQKELRAIAAARGVSLSELFREAALATLVDHRLCDQKVVKQRT